MEKRRQGNFQRTKFYAYVKLGSRQKSMRKYKRATGRHNKTRQKWRSRPPMVEIGYKNEKSGRGLISGKTPVWVFNLKDLEKAGKDSIIIIGKIGAKNKMQIAKEIEKRKLEVFNLNTAKFIKENEPKKAEEKKAI